MIPVKPADIFRRKSSSQPSKQILESPLKCLNQAVDPSPTKGLPTLVKNPFHKPVKRRLNLDDDEDANLEPPKQQIRLDDIVMTTRVKNWLDGTSSPMKTDSNRSIYQHPYLSWLPLYPRKGSLVGEPFPKNFEMTNKMFIDWIDSFEDLVKSFLSGKCSHFFLYADHFSVLFEQNRAYISPLTYGLNGLLSKAGIEVGPSSEIPQAPQIESENEDSANYLAKLGWSPKSLKSTFKERRESSNDMKTRIKPLAYIEGEENILKLVNFFKINDKITVQTLGKFAGIPPTLLSPSEFRLGTCVKIGADLERLFRY